MLTTVHRGVDNFVAVSFTLKPQGSTNPQGLPQNFEPLPSSGKRYQLTRNGGSHPLWSADGQSLYFDRASQLFQLAVNLKEPSSNVEPVALPIKGFVQAEYRRQFDIMPNGREFLVLIPIGEMTS